MAALPTYVKILANGYSEESQPRTLVTEFEVGPAQHLEVSSNDVVFRQAVLRIAGVDYTAFKAWVSNDIAGGSAWWDWVDPIDQILKQARFKGGQLGAAKPTSSRVASWKIPVIIETWG